jgi:hypothetical protein
MELGVEVGDVSVLLGIVLLELFLFLFIFDLVGVYVKMVVLGHLQVHFAISSATRQIGWKRKIWDSSMRSSKAIGFVVPA